MAHGLNSVLKRSVATANCGKSEGKGIGSRRIFAPHFKLQVLDSYRNDADCKGNQRATARKYGIHRRQIQKWLQVENTLRSSVNGGGGGAKEKSVSAEQRAAVPEIVKCEFATLSCGRQRGDDDDGAPRVPALAHSPTAAPWQGAPLPLDFTTHGRGASPDPSAPMDLSFKRPTSPTNAPVRCPPLRTPEASPSLVSQPPPHHPDVWDLSTKSVKRKCEDSETSPKPVKLFKPYLDDIGDERFTSTTVKIEPAMACQACDAFYYNNNNNNVCDASTNTYTLLELQPKSALSYYYPPYPSYSSEYEIGGNYLYEDAVYGQNLAPLKQRQSYSLDFKLSAIDCYYQDSVCKGNQRAVATKYNVHRRQVQKWLKQAEELRLRNETVKQMHAVR